MAKSECYQCDTKIEVADVTQVHPLCAECQNTFDDWLQNEVMCL